MDLHEFEGSLDGGGPPPQLSGPLQGLWHAGRIDRDPRAWEASHDVVNADPSAAASWVHAWLHRQEGDLPNAAYWYRRAGRPAGSGDLRSEWREIVRALLEGRP